MRTIEVSAKTRELAIKDALEQLGVERDEVHVEILDEGSAGLFGFGARKVKLKVSTEVPGSEPARSRPPQRERLPQQGRSDQAPRPTQSPRPSQQQQPQRNAPAPRHGQAPRPAQRPRAEPPPRPAPPPRRPAPAPRVFSGPPDSEAESLVKEVVQRMGIEATITSATDESGAVSIKIESPDSAILIGRKGRSLESLQYLVNRMSPKTEGDEGERITIDIEGYLGRRQEALEDLAHRLADRARESGRRQRTKPMTSQERRAIHVALEGDDTIKTYSVGDAGDRYVIIAPKDERPDGDRPPRGRGFRGERGPRGGDRGGDRRERGPRDPNGPQQPLQQGERAEGGDQPRADQPRAEDTGAPRPRRRSRRGGRGRGPRPEAPAVQSDTPESGPQDS